MLRANKIVILTSMWTAQAVVFELNTAKPTSECKKVYKQVIDEKRVGHKTFFSQGDGHSIAMHFCLKKDSGALDVKETNHLSDLKYLVECMEAKTFRVFSMILSESSLARGDRDTILKEEREFISNELKGTTDLVSLPLITGDSGKWAVAACTQITVKMETTTTVKEMTEADPQVGKIDPIKPKPEPEEVKEIKEEPKLPPKNCCSRIDKNERVKTGKDFETAPSDKLCIRPAVFDVYKTPCSALMIDKHPRNAPIVFGESKDKTCSKKCDSWFRGLSMNFPRGYRKTSPVVYEAAEKHQLLGWTFQE